VGSDDAAFEGGRAEPSVNFVHELVRAQDEERRRIALELHDGVGQILASLELGLARLDHQNDAGQRRALMQELVSSVRAAVRELQRVTRGLHPSMLDDLGLLAALERLTVEQQSLTGIPIDLTVVDLPEISRDEALTAYRIVQEALCNAARHAAPGRIHVEVACSDGALAVAIDDDGHGFSPQDRLRVGLGLRGMRERVKRHGGTMAIESHPGDGTTVRASIPLEGQIP
jgi:signal transduction histidine kinase